MKRPRLNILRTFEAAGRLKSFSKAADELSITQAAVSQQMRQLEAYLDAPLFVRHHRRLSLTNIGAAYLNVVHEALDRLDNITDQLFPDRSEQMVTLRCTSSVATLWLAPQLGSFQKHHPQIDLRIRTMDHDLAENSMSENKHEIAIVSEENAGPNAEKLLDITIIPICSPKMLQGREQPLKPEDLLKYELIHMVGYKDDWHRWFRSFQSSELAVPGGLSVDGSMIAIEAALRGDGIMLGRRPFVDNHLLSGDLVEVFSDAHHLHASYYIQQSTNSRKSNAVTKVADWLKMQATR